MAAGASAVAGSSTTAVVLDAEASTGHPQPQQAGQQQGQQQQSQHVQGNDSDQPADERLVLRLVPRKKKKEKVVSWTDDTVDNEGMGKKSSKKCCIFHANRPFGEWDDSDDSDTECRPDLPDSGEGPPDQGGGVPHGSSEPGPS